MATGSSDGTAKVWDSTTGRCILLLTGHSNAVNRLDLNAIEATHVEI